jgi:tetratricopeptide (TPR) repeat protein
MKTSGMIDSSGNGGGATELSRAAAPGPSPAQAGKTPAPVSVRQEELVLPTYLPAAPSRLPMFLEKRVYQGSSGKVYPLPFTDRIAEKAVDRKWQAIWLENEFLRVLLLPEIGGRIHALQDKSNGYDLIYNQLVIKPALVGLAGPWISGGIEFNWPQHHRPATFLPADCEVEKHADGSVTVWCSDHDPMARMKGMHGVCLHPATALLELKVRAYNRTEFVQTFLWWANVATRVHEGYQSFFPPDVRHVADHARRSMSEYPLAQGFYYGVNYKERGRAGVSKNEAPRQFVPPHVRQQSEVTGASSDIPLYAPNDLSFYANIPTPCSYMCLRSTEDFFGGYDYKKQAGIVHVAGHHVSPGKKQWTWGNHEFGYAWDRNLTEPDEQGEYAPYIELMAGVYTDNQPDFSFLQPGETKTWSQFWYPIQKIGPPSQANLEAAISLKLSGRMARLGVCVTAALDSAQVQLLNQDRSVLIHDCELAPGKPWVREIELPKGAQETELRLRVIAASGREVIAYQPQPRAREAAPLPATEPPLPSDIASVDELFITGLHLEQYRHATRCPTAYWREGLRRDPMDCRCHNAMGLWHLRRGEFAQSEAHFRAAIKRLTLRNANPYDGEAFYNLGLCLRYQAMLDGNPEERGMKSSQAYDAFHKAAWNQAWVSAARHSLAELDCAGQRWASALNHLNLSLRCNADNTRARDLQAVVLRKMGAAEESEALLGQTLALDPLDWWARHLAGRPMSCDLQTGLDIAHDCARAGLYEEAITLLNILKPLKRDLPDQSWGAEPLVQYTLGWLHEQAGQFKAAAACYKTALRLPPDYCHPARLEEIAILQSAQRHNPRDARALYYLGNLFYDRRRHAEAIRLWERSAALAPDFPVVWRNLGVGYFNVRRKPAKARLSYERSFRGDPGDARVLFERDQLWKRLCEKPERRLRELEKHAALVLQRDDLSVELCALFNQTGQHQKALELLVSRRFQPWEGGEGAALGQYTRAHLALGRAALAAGPAAKAREHFAAALAAPENLGEAKHLLANDSDVQLWLGRAAAAMGDRARARACWEAAANFKGDFQEMSVRAFSEMTYYSALAWKELGQARKAAKLLRDLLAFARKLEKAPAKIDYFATSLPTMLLFDDDLQHRAGTRAMFLQAQAWLGLGRTNKARALLKDVLRRDPNHALAADLAAEIRA